MNAPRKVILAKATLTAALALAAVACVHTKPVAMNSPAISAPRIESSGDELAGLHPIAPPFKGSCSLAVVTVDGQQGIWLCNRHGGIFPGGQGEYRIATLSCSGTDPNNLACTPKK